MTLNDAFCSRLRGAEVATGTGHNEQPRRHWTN